MWALADRIEEHAEEFATIEVLDNGKPLGEARAVDIALTIELLRYYAGWATKIAGSVPPNSIPGMLSMIRREPVGVVAAITPWNFPISQAVDKIAAAMLAGCTVILKPSEVTPVSALAFAEAAAEAGVPAGVLNLVNGSGFTAGEALVRHPDVDMITFTGSTRVGKRIAAVAAERVARVSLELGGKSATILLSLIHI